MNRPAWPRNFLKGFPVSTSQMNTNLSRPPEHNWALSLDAHPSNTSQPCPVSSYYLIPVNTIYSRGKNVVRPKVTNQCRSSMGDSCADSIASLFCRYRRSHNSCHRLKIRKKQLYFGHPNQSNINSLRNLRTAKSGIKLPILCNKNNRKVQILQRNQNEAQKP